MAIVKDWAQEAANELASHISVEGIPRQRIASSYKELILKHFPIPSDMAFMPVPRCETCKYWQSTSGEMGDCARTIGLDSDLMGTTVESKARANVGGDEFGQPVLITLKDFGCVQWEQK